MLARAVLPRVAVLTLSVLLAGACAPAAPSAPSAAAKAGSDQTTGDFYRGKTIRMVVAFPPGGGLDTVSRLLAKHMRRFIPGDPNIIAENRPGAAGLVAANAVYNTDPKDGTVIGAFADGTALKQALGEDGVRYDAARFNWLGAAVKTTAACAVRRDAGINSIEEVIAGREVIVGATGPGTTTNDTPRILNATLGTHFKLVSGYPGSPEIQLAIERKEVEGFCLDMFAFEGNFRPTLEGESAFLKLIVLLTGDPAASSLSKDVSVAESLALTDEGKQLIRLVRAPSAMSKPFAVAPEVPAERVAALQWALAQTFADPEFLDDARRANQLVVPSSAEEVTRIVQEVLGTPSAAIAKLDGIIK